MNKSQRLRYEFEYMVQQGIGEPGFNDRLQINLLLPLLVARTSYCVTQSLFLFFNKVLAKYVKKSREKTVRDTKTPELPATKRSFIRSTFRAP